MTPQQAGYTTASDLDHCDDRDSLADIREESIYAMLCGPQGKLRFASFGPEVKEPEIEFRGKLTTVPCLFDVTRLRRIDELAQVTPWKNGWCIALIPRSEYSALDHVPCEHIFLGIDL